MVHRTLVRLFICLIFAFNAYAEDPAVKADNPAIYNEAEKIYNSVLSPYCPGRLLSHCPSGSADKLKKRIYSELEEGKDPQTVMDGLYAEFGDEIKSTPDFSGFGLVGWIVPGVFLLLGFALIVRFVKKQKS